MALTLSGTNGITLPATSNVQNAAVCAWVNFNGISGARPVIRASYNVTSVTRTTTGSYTITFTNAISDANYAVAGLAQRNVAGTGVNDAIMSIQSSSTYTMTTTGFSVYVTDQAANLQDCITVTLMVVR
jgi:hypothetical protein